MNLKELLGEELYTQVQDKIGNGEVELLVNNKKDSTYVPKSRLDAVLGQKKVLADKIDLLEITIQEAQTDLSNTEALKKQLLDAQGEIEKAKKDVVEVRRESEIKFAIAKSGAKNQDLITKLLEKDKVVFKEDGSIEGLTEQIDKLKTDVPELFVTTPQPPKDDKSDNKGTDKDDNKGNEDQQPQGGTGSPGNGGKGNGGKPESIGAKLAKRRVASSAPAVDFFK